MRWPASAYGAGPSRGTGTGKCAAPATEDAISRMPASPIGVRGRVSPWARLKHKYTRGVGPEGGRSGIG